MLYLGIDQHARQITISLRDENGDVLQARQVSTQPEKINAFFQRLTRERLRSDEPFIAWQRRPQPWGEIYVAPVDGHCQAIRLTNDKWEDGLPFWCSLEDLSGDSHAIENIISEGPSK